jgi:hypothetical protein
MEGASIEVKEDSVQLHLEKHKRDGDISIHHRTGLNNNVNKEENLKDWEDREK